jgi:hypothetical protein
LLALIGLLAAGAGAVLVHDAVLPEPPSAVRDYHRLVGGLGLGPAIDIQPCAFSFDPRLCRCCPNDVGPIPCGRVFCPYHAGALCDYPSLAP